MLLYTSICIHIIRQHSSSCVRVCVRNNEQEIKQNCMLKSQYFNLFPHYSSEFIRVQREKSLWLCSCWKLEHNVNSRPPDWTHRFSFIKTKLIPDLHTKTFGYKTLGMCKCSRRLFEDCSFVFLSPQSFASTKCEVDNVREAADSEKSCDKMLHNPMTKRTTRLSSCNPSNLHLSPSSPFPTVSPWAL